MHLEQALWARFCTVQILLLLLLYECIKTMQIIRLNCIMKMCLDYAIDMHFNLFDLSVSI